MATHDAGAEVECPGCRQVVLQKAMIPVLGPGGTGIAYLCPACARALIVPPSVPSPDTSPDDGDDGDAAVDADEAGAESGAA